MYKNQPNLNNIPALQLIPVRNDIVLRPLEDIDATEILQILKSDPSIRAKVTFASKIHTPEDVANQVRKYKKDSHLIRYAISDAGRVVGLLSFWRDVDMPFDTPDNPNDYGLGYFLDPSRRGEGLVTAAVNSLLKAAVENVPVRQFIAYCTDDNKSSVSVLAGIGFKPTNLTFVEQNNGWVERKYTLKPSEIKQI